MKSELEVYPENVLSLLPVEVIMLLEPQPELTTHDEYNCVLLFGSLGRSMMAPKLALTNVDTGRSTKTSLG